MPVSFLLLFIISFGRSFLMFLKEKIGDCAYAILACLCVSVCNLLIQSKINGCNSRMLADNNSLLVRRDVQWRPFVDTDVSTLFHRMNRLWNHLSQFSLKRTKPGELRSSMIALSPVCSLLLFLSSRIILDICFSPVAALLFLLNRKCLS